MGYQELHTEFSNLGFLTRGGFYPVEADGIPVLSAGEKAKSVLMVGNVGSRDFWKQFTLSEEYLSEKSDPMDLWTKRVIGLVADKFGGEALFPSDGPPYHPFQQWASRAEQLYPSPIGLFVSPKWGTWHALRAAIIFPDIIEGFPGLEQVKSPCLECKGQPCLSACPVEAFAPDKMYDYLGCAKHITSDAGQDCAHNGCLARRLCPVGQDYTLNPEHAEFHMSAFIKARRDAGEIE